MKYTNQAALLKTTREKKKMSQMDLAKALNLTSSQFISNVERGLCGIPDTHMKILAKKLKVNPMKFIDAALADHRIMLIERVV